MIIYNVTVNIDNQVVEEWKRYMVEEHIPDVMNTGCFKEYRMSKIVTGEQEGGVSFSIQYLCESHSVLEGYQTNHAPKLQADHTSKFAGKFAAFRTILELIDNQVYEG